MSQKGSCGGQAIEGSTSSCLVCVDQHFYQCLCDGIEIQLIRFVIATMIDNVVSEIDK